MADRKIRAIALVVVGITAAAIASLVYLRANTSSPKPVAATTVDRNLVTTDIVTYRFVLPTVGWAMVVLASPPPSLAGHAWLFATVDGARHWREQKGFGDVALGRAPFAMDFLDARNGFVLVNGHPDQLYGTSDGGSHWVGLPMPDAAASAVGFIDRHLGWLLVPGSGQSMLTGGPAVEHPARIYVTENGGLTWTSLPSTPTDATVGGMSSRSEAWLGSFALEIPHLYASSDGGRTWQRSQMPPPPGKTWDTGSVYRTDVVPLPGSGAVATVDGPTFDEVNRFISFDAGATWSYMPEPPGMVSFVDRTHWWATTPSTLYKSSDAGQTWMVASTGLPELFFPQVLDSTHAWAQMVVTGGNGLATTSDGGLHWTRRSVPRL